MASLVAIQTEYAYGLQDLGNLLEQINASPTTDVRDKAIAGGIRWYSRLVPNIKVVDTTPIQSGYYPLPADYAQSSRIVSIEFPRDQSPPAYLNSKNFRTQRTPSGENIYINPNPTDTFRLAYTTEHLQDASTISTAHERIVGIMSAAIACEEFAARFANAVTNNLDSVNYRDKARAFAEKAKEYREQVEREMRSPQWGQFFRADVDALRMDKSWRT